MGLLAVLRKFLIIPERMASLSNMIDSFVFPLPRRVAIGSYTCVKFDRVISSRCPLGVFV